MNTNQLPPDDPRLTAYALGELEGDDRAAVEAALRDDPVARATVADIRATGAQLEAALASEPLPACGELVKSATQSAPPLAHAAILPGRDPRKLDGGDWFADKPLRFPSLYYIIGGLAAAAFALMLALRPPASRPAPVVPPVTVAAKPRIPNAEPAAPAAPAPASTGTAVAANEEAKTTVVSALPTAKSVEDLANQVGPLALGPVKASEPIRDAGNEKVAAPDAIVPVTPKTGVAVAQVQQTSVRANDARADGQGATLTYPSDEKFVIDARPQDEKIIVAVKPAIPAPRTAPSSTIYGTAPANVPVPSFLEEAKKLSEITHLAPLTIDPSIALPSGAAAASNDASAKSYGGALAVTDKGGVPSSENRGLPGSLPAINLDKVAPRFGMPLLSPGAVDRDNDFVSVVQHPVSSFGIDTDTAGYADVRQFLQKRQRPPRETVHIEEMLNFFPFRYSPPKGDAPFAASMEVADAPWTPSHRLVRIGLQAREETSTARPPANLVFVIDVLETEKVKSGLPKIRDAIEYLVGHLRADDRVAIVSSYGGGSFVLESTPAANTKEIFAALATMRMNGSNNRAKALQFAYDQMRGHLLSGGANHIVLCTDGNAEMTVTAEGSLTRFIADRAKEGMTLTVFGFGMGIYKDSMIEVLSESGKANASYIDSRREAEKLLVEDVNGPPVTIAKNVAVEVQFNPAKVARYRLIGYENRELKREDFSGSALDAAEVGSGHAATALYEIVPAAPRAGAGAIANAEFVSPDPNELLTMKVHYKKPGGALKRMLDFPLLDSRQRFVDASADFKFAAAVAGLGMILRDSPHKGGTTLGQVIEWAESGAGDDPGGYRSEFVELAREAEKMDR